MNQSIENKTSPITGMVGTALSVASRMTIAKPGTPWASLEAISDAASTRSGRRAMETVKYQAK